MSDDKPSEGRLRGRWQSIGGAIVLGLAVEWLARQLFDSTAETPAPGSYVIFIVLVFAIGAVAVWAHLKLVGPRLAAVPDRGFKTAFLSSLGGAVLLGAAVAVAVSTIALLPLASASWFQFPLTGVVTWNYEIVAFGLFALWFWLFVDRQNDAIASVAHGIAFAVVIAMAFRARRGAEEVNVWLTVLTWTVSVSVLTVAVGLLAASRAGRSVREWAAHLMEPR